MNYYYYQELPCGSEAAWVQCAVGAADPKMENLLGILVHEPKP